MTSPTQRRHEELVALLTEIRDRLPEPVDVTEEPPHEHVWKRRQNVTSKGYVMTAIEVCECGAARYAEPVGPAPADVDPDEARSYHDGYHDGVSVAESVARMTEERECKRLAGRADLWRERCQKAEADLAHLNRERDFQTARADDLGIRVQKAEARYAALRADVERVRRNRTTLTDVLMCIADVLDLDDERGQA